MKRLSRNAQVLKFFAQQCDGIGHIRLQKLAYLADLESRQLLGHPITTFEYVWYDHGPFDREFYNAVDELAAAGYATREDRRFGTAGHVVKLVLDTGEPAAFDLTPAEVEILAYVAREYMKTAFDTLLEDIVYETPPMKAARRGERVPMEVMDNRQKDRIGFDLEDVIAAERQAEKGRQRPASDVFDELRTQAG